MDNDIKVLALIKGEHRFIIMFRDDQAGEVLKTIGQLAINPDLPFSWYDAAVLSQKVRNTQR